LPALPDIKDESSVSNHWRILDSLSAIFSSSSSPACTRALWFTCLSSDCSAIFCCSTLITAALAFSSCCTVLRCSAQM
jgi:hypothetical protein